jgi:hypothetical protein
VTYSTFDPQSVDVLRMDFIPETVTAHGNPLTRRRDLDGEGYIFDDSTRVLRIRHDRANDIDVQGKGGHAPPLYITFDSPHLPAGTLLNGQYPSGVIDWGTNQWRMSVPEGKLGTFNLSIADSAAPSAKFDFYAPRVFVGVDVYNSGKSDAVIRIHAAGAREDTREKSFTLKPGELRRLRTGWTDPITSVIFSLKNGEGLRFDNLAYLHD